MDGVFFLRCTNIDHFVDFSIFISRPAAMFWFKSEGLWSQRCPIGLRLKKTALSLFWLDSEQRPDSFFPVPRMTASFISDSVVETVGCLRQPQTEVTWFNLKELIRKKDGGSFKSSPLEIMDFQE